MAAPVLVVLLYGAVRNNRVLLNSLLGSAILVALAFAIFSMAKDKGFTARVMAGMISLILILVAVGYSCTGGAGDPVRYAAIGDSYSSGEGAKAAGYAYDNRLEYGPGAGAARDDAVCHRSTRAYPGLLQHGLGNSTMLFAACSGATIEDLTTRGQHPHTPPQLETLRAFAASGKIDIVTVTIGGNDLDFRHILTECATRRCAPGDPLGIEAEFDQAVAGLPKRLAETYAAIRRVAGDAVPLVVIGYPEILPRSGCPSVIGMDGPELTEMRDMTRRGDEAVRSAAILAGAFYVDTLDAFANHLICSPRPYAQGIIVPGADTILSEGDFLTGAFHPTPSGHRCLEQIILDTYALPRGIVPPPLGTPLPDQPNVGSARPCP